MVPQVRQSLEILALPQLDLQATIQIELDNNPFLEKREPLKPDNNFSGLGRPTLTYSKSRQSLAFSSEALDFRMSLISQPESLQDILIRQLGMFADTEDILVIGQEIIGNLDENGYLKVALSEISKSLAVPLERVEHTLSIIQQFEPAGIAACSVAECLLIQLRLSGDKDPIIREIIEFHLEDVAKKNYSRIAKSLKTSIEVIEPVIKRILRLDPKPGRNYSSDSAIRVIPDILLSVDEESSEIKIELNNEDSCGLYINETYNKMLQDANLGQEAKDFLHNKLRNALELVRAVSKRQDTLRKIAKAVVSLQEQAIRQDFSVLCPLTFKEIAQRVDLHETTVCRAVMNKYVSLPTGMVVSLKSFFTSRLNGKDGQSCSSGQAKTCIQDLIDQEDKHHPLSDAAIASYLAQEKNILLSRRTVAKYREDLKILQAAFRKIK